MYQPAPPEVELVLVPSMVGIMATDVLHDRGITFCIEGSNCPETFKGTGSLAVINISLSLPVGDSVVISI